MNAFLEKSATLWPEISLALGALGCLGTGLAPTRQIRRVAPLVAAAALVVAGLLNYCNSQHVVALTGMAIYAKYAVVAIGLLLLLLAAGVPEQLRVQRAIDSGQEKFDAGNVHGGEFYAFFLLSLAGVMLCAGATDLVWLFLALELTSLPTYVMVSTARDRMDAQEAGVKYFFLGALAAAVFLYGFALIYGATGSTEYGVISAYIADHGASPLFKLGVVMAIIGIGFKIAAFPMHFYAADVYQGANIAVTAFLAFVPKTAGFLALLGLIGLLNPLRAAGGALPDEIGAVIWVMAAFTMTLGNVLGLLQNNVKRVLAYSSVAHSGYMLVGLLAVTGTSGRMLDSGSAAVLFYLVAYALGNFGCFAVLACLRDKDGDEAQGFGALNGLVKRDPWLAGILLISVLSLIGIPPMIGFVGKIYLFGAAVHAGYIGLVIVAVVNSAISAVYYLRMVSACFFGEADGQTIVGRPAWRHAAATLAGAAILLLGPTAGWTGLTDAAFDATQPRQAPEASAPTDAPALGRATPAAQADAPAI